MALVVGAQHLELCELLVHVARICRVGDPLVSVEDQLRHPPCWWMLATTSRDCQHGLVVRRTREPFVIELRVVGLSSAVVVGYVTSAPS